MINIKILNNNIFIYLKKKLKPNNIQYQEKYTLPYIKKKIQKQMSLYIQISDK